tara:strand:- start:134 stop:358 length:225 start_codon:yes stop_codon:yes gene_type:complete
MYQELFILGGYGHFVWPSFVFTLVTCFLYYIKTKKELQKQEKVFISEFRYLNVKRTNTFKEKKVAKEVLSASSF